MRRGADVTRDPERQAESMGTSLDIAHEAQLRPITEVAEGLGLEPDEIDLYGKTKAKIDLGVLDRLRDRRSGKLVCVTAITPTKSGEGKTTIAIALTEASAGSGAARRWRCASRRSGLSSASRAAARAAATRRSSRWRI